MIFVRSLYRLLVNSYNQLFLQVFYTFIHTGCLPKIFHTFTGILYFHTHRVSPKDFSYFYRYFILPYRQGVSQRLFIFLHTINCSICHTYTVSQNDYVSNTISIGNVLYTYIYYIYNICIVYVVKERQEKAVFSIPFFKQKDPSVIPKERTGRKWIKDRILLERD